MDQKFYQIKTKKPEDWQIVHELLMRDGTLEDNIPSRSCECVKDYKDVPEIGTYKMTTEEANLLREDPRIEYVSLDPDFHEETRIEVKSDSFNRFNRNIKNYRLFRRWIASESRYDYFIPTNNPTVSERNRTGYQLLRCTQRDNPFTGDLRFPVNRDINYRYDGLDVDCIVTDDGCWHGHPEFVKSDDDPPNYITGNVINRSASCGVLDLIIHGPYYLDPDYFNADPNRLTTRWDGTLSPRGDVARSWWSSPSNRSPGFPWNGSIDVGTYDLAQHSGDRFDRNIRPANSAMGYHGTAAASLVYGKTFGWAFNSNKWSVAVVLSTVTNGIRPSNLFDAIRVFHEYKPVNPKFGTKNPTVVNASWGSAFDLTETQLSSNITSWGFRGSRRNEPEESGTGSVPNFLRTNMGLGSGNYQFTSHYDISGYPASQLEYFPSAELESGRRMVSSGVIFVCSGGNGGRFIAHPKTTNHYNYYVYVDGRKYYTNRPGWPAQIGWQDSGNIDTNPDYQTIVVGAIDDQFANSQSIPEEFDATYTSTLSTQGFYERLARASEYVASYRGADYSNRGGGCDIYAPADGTLAATSWVTQMRSDLPIYPRYSTDISCFDMHFGGTSAASPVACGLIACMVQNNRSWGISQIKSHIRSSVQQSTAFWTGPNPTSANDPAWIVPFSRMGAHGRIIYETTVGTSTPNETFRPTYGTTVGTSNERFTISRTTTVSNRIKIWGVREFLSSENQVDLSVRNGFYRVSLIGDVSRSALRINPTNDRVLQLSNRTTNINADNSLWGDMQITVNSGTFVYQGTEIFYSFGGGIISESPSGSFEPTPPPPTPSGAVPGTPGSITGASLSVTGQISAGGNITGLISDDRLKTNQNIIENAIEKVEKLNGFTYNFNDIGKDLGFDPNKRYSGVSAQEVDEVLPQAIDLAPADKNYLTVKYDKIIPLLIEAVKDLKNDIDELKEDSDTNK